MIIVLYPDCSTLQGHTRDSLMLLLDRHSQKCVFFITTEKLGWSNLIGDEQPKGEHNHLISKHTTPARK